MHLGRYAAILALITYARHQYIKLDKANSNTALQCLFYGGSNSLSDMLDYRWTLLLESILAASDLLMLIGGIELYCAQGPYSMKGLVAGILYGLLGLFMMLSGVISLPFKMKSLGWGTGTLSCGFWYLLMMSIYMVIVITISALVMKQYQMRKREDVLPNEHIFAERYYSRDN